MTEDVIQVARNTVTLRRWLRRRERVRQLRRLAIEIADELKGELIQYVADSVYARYMALKKYVEKHDEVPLPSFPLWLSQCGTLENTFRGGRLGQRLIGGRGGFSFRTRQAWSAYVVREAAAITDTQEDLTWLYRGIEERLNAKPGARESLHQIVVGPGTTSYIDRFTRKDMDSPTLAFYVVLKKSAR